MVQQFEIKKINKQMLTKFSNNWWIKTKENCYTTSKQKKNEITDFLAKQKHNVF